MNIIEQHSKRLLHTEIKTQTAIRNGNCSLYDDVKVNMKMFSEKKKMISKNAFDNLLRKDNMLTQGVVNVEEENGMNCVNTQNDIEIESSSNMSKFLSKIPKPSSAFSIKYDKYVDMPTKIPKLKST
jgi:hypothetical protein